MATSRNVHEMPDLARLAKELGVDQLTITCLLTDWGKGEMAAAIAAINIARDNARAEEFIGAAVKVAAEIGAAAGRGAGAAVFALLSLLLALVQDLYRGEWGCGAVLRDCRFQRG